MYPFEIEDAVRIDSAAFAYQEEDSAARVALAAFILLAGPMYVYGIATEADASVVPPRDILSQMGFSEFPYPKTELASLSLPTEFLASDEVQDCRSLAAMVQECNRSPNPQLAALIVAKAMRADDALVRICGLASAIEFYRFDFPTLAFEVYRLITSTFDAFALSLLETLFARLTTTSFRRRSALKPTAPSDSLPPGLIAVHGTILPFSQANAPDWSVPGTGDLFNHIQGIRPDIYHRPDYFRWEGGYTDYARDVASQNLADWLDARALNGIDVVAHSHGANVVIAAMNKGGSFRKVVLLSCPVHWHKYSLPSSLITNQVVSVRTKFDLVILMDRGGQSFPLNTIPDHYLPFWYTAHGATTNPKNWTRHRLDRFL